MDQHSPPPTDFDWITDHIAVGGWVDPQDWEHLARDETITAVVDLRNEAQDDADLLAQFGITYLHLPTEDRMAVSLSQLIEAVQFIEQQRERGNRTLVHCHHGIGRSAMVALCALVASGEQPLSALERTKDRRWKISPSPEQFEGWVEWLIHHRGETAALWDIPEFEAFAMIAYRHLADQSQTEDTRNTASAGS